MNKVLIIDNYDSFTYNLVHLVEQLGYSVVVWRNDQFSLEGVEEFEHIILSPGPGLPHQAGILIETIKKYAATKKVLGICLGHQAIAEAFGGELYNLEIPRHGIANVISIQQEDKLFTQIPNPFKAGLYHSWAVEKASLPDCLQVTAEDTDGVIMAIQHKQYSISGIQFHPESILTEYGKEIVRNWLFNDFIT